MTNQASEDELRTLDEILSQAFTDGASDTMWIADRHVEIFATAKEELLNLIRTEKLKLLAEVRERVVGEDEKLVIPDYPKTDDEGEPLYSKRAAKEGRKQVTARYHTRKELRKKQRTELTKLEAEVKPVATPPNKKEEL